MLYVRRVRLLSRCFDDRTTVSGCVCDRRCVARKCGDSRCCACQAEDDPDTCGRPNRRCELCLQVATDDVARRGRGDRRQDHRRSTVRLWQRPGEQERPVCRRVREDQGTRRCPEGRAAKSLRQKATSRSPEGPAEVNSLAVRPSRVSPLRRQCHSERTHTRHRWRDVCSRPLAACGI